MSAVVVDASVVLKWFIPETLSAEATTLLADDQEFLAPDLLLAETVSAIRKKVLRGELTVAAGRALAADIGRLPIETVTCRSLATDALALATVVPITTYDAMYVALAVRARTEFVTADERLHRSVRAFPRLARTVRLLSRQARS